MVNQVWDQEPAYDSGTLFGKCSGNHEVFTNIPRPESRATVKTSAIPKLKKYILPTF